MSIHSGITQPVVIDGLGGIIKFGIPDLKAQASRGSDAGPRPHPALGFDTRALPEAWLPHVIIY